MANQFHQVCLSHETSMKIPELWCSQSFWVGELGGVGRVAMGDGMEALGTPPILCLISSTGLFLSYTLLFIFYFFIFLLFLGPHPWHIEVPRLGV